MMEFLPVRTNARRDYQQKPCRVLIVEDEKTQAELVQDFLRVSGPFQTVWADRLARLWQFLAQQSFDILLMDYRLPDGNGLEALSELRRRGIDLPVMMVTGQGDERLAVQAMQLGAADYLVKGSDDLMKLPSRIQKVLREHELERSVQRSLEHIRSQALLLNNVRDAIVVWNTQGLITYLNPAAETLLGWNAKESLGLAVDPDYLQAFEPAVHTPSAEDTAGMEIERRYRQPGQKTIWVSSRVSALRDFGAGGRLIGYMDVCRDITPRKKALEALRLSQERYALATAAAKVGVWDWNILTGELYLDPNIKAILGYREDEIANTLKAWTALIHPEDYKLVMTAAQAHIEGRSSEYTYEHRIFHKDGSIRWIHVHGKRILNARGEVVRMIGTDTDITERKAMEEQITATQARLTQAVRLAAVGELASAVAHHINNPLTTIIAESQLLLQQLPASHTSRESAEMIEQAGWRVQNAVQQLIDFAQPSYSTLENLDINQTIEQALELVGEQIQTMGIALQVNLAPQALLIHGNSRQLCDLWVNLLRLARDATDDGNLHAISITSHEEAGVAKIAIGDDGRPIPATELEHIFTPDFYQTPGGRGTGLELNVCLEIVRQHGGDITVESDPAHGTIFHVSFPLEVSSERV